MGAYKQWESKNIAHGSAKTMDTPKSINDKRLDLAHTRFRTMRGGHLIAETSGAQNRNDPGITIISKHQNGSGQCINAAGECETRHENGAVTGTKGPNCSYGNGNINTSFDGHQLSVSSSSATHCSMGGAGFPGDRSGKPKRAMQKTSQDRSKMEVTPADRGFMCGGTFGVACGEMNLASGGNCSLGATGALGISGGTDTAIGSQQGGLHLYGAGVAMGAQQGPFSLFSSQSMNFYTNDRLVMKSFGNDIFANATKIYFNSSAPGPLSTSDVIAQIGQSGAAAVPALK